jgi:hypothetical protein
VEDAANPHPPQKIWDFIKLRIKSVVYPVADENCAIAPALTKLYQLSNSASSLGIT